VTSVQSLGMVDVPDGGDLSPTTSCDEADAKYVAVLPPLTTICAFLPRDARSASAVLLS